MDLKRTTHRLLWRLGYDLVGFVPIAHPLARRRHLMRHLGIDLVFDVGANIGQYGRQLRDIGYRGRIVSFEPLTGAFAELARRAERDPMWQAFPYGLSNRDGDARMHVAAKNVFSSLETPEPLLAETDSQAAMVQIQTVELRRLDGIFNDLHGGARGVWLKLDVQGHEVSVLEGAAQILDRVSALQMEISLTQLYANERDLRGVLDWTNHAGFDLWALEPGFSDARTGRLLQVDGIFVRKKRFCSENDA